MHNYCKILFWFTSKHLHIGRMFTHMCKLYEVALAWVFARMFGLWICELGKFLLKLRVHKICTYGNRPAIWYVKSIIKNCIIYRFPLGYNAPMIACFSQQYINKPPWYNWFSRCSCKADGTLENKLMLKPHTTKVH